MFKAGGPSRPPDGTKRPFGTKGYNLLFSLTFSGNAPFRPNWLIELNPVVILLKTNPLFDPFFGDFMYFSALLRLFKNLLSSPIAQTRFEQKVYHVFNMTVQVFAPGGWLIGEKGQSEISLKIVSGVIDLE